MNEICYLLKNLGAFLYHILDIRGKDYNSKSFGKILGYKGR